MNLLLDTQALLWWRLGSPKLGIRARRTIERYAPNVRVSAASAWEMAIKVRAGRLTLPEALDLWLPAAVSSSGFRTLSVTIDHAAAIASLPEHHADPFDRLLIAQAQREALTIVTSDPAFDGYEV